MVLLIPKICFIALFLFVIGGNFFAFAQEPIPAAAKSEISRYRQQQDIFSEDLHGLGYIEAAQILTDETSSETKLLYYCRQGKDYFNGQQYEKALAEFKNALDWNPQYKPALKYVELIEEKIRQKQQLKEKQALAQRKTKQEAQKRQDKEYARLSQKEKLKYEQNIKQEQEHYRNLKKINETRAKEKNIECRNLEEKNRIARQRKDEELAQRKAAKEVLLSKGEKAKQEQIIKLEQEKSKNLKSLNESRFRKKLSQKLKEQDLIEQSQKELPQSQNIPEAEGLETAIAQSTVVSRQQAAASNGAKYKEFIANNFVPDSLELDKIQRGFEDKYTKLLKENETIKKDYYNLLAQIKELLADSDRARELKAFLGKSNSELELYKKENERVKKDYSNLLLQVKMLLVYKQRIKKLEEMVEENKIDISLLEKEKEAAILEKNELKRRNKKLEQPQSQILKDRDSYKEAYEKLKDTYEKLYSEAVTNKLKVKEFMNDAPVLERKNKDMELELKQLRGENEKIKKDYGAALTKLNQSMLDSRKAKGLENILVKSKVEVNSITKERNALKEGRNRVLSQMKGLLGGRRRVKELESLLQESNADIKAMQKENDIIRKDYNNLLVQVKASSVDKKHLKEVLEALEKNKTGMNLLVKDSEAVKAQNAELKDKIKQFEEEQIKLVKERDAYKIADSAVKELKGGIKEMEALLEKDKVNMVLLEKEKESAKAENMALKDKAKKLEELEKKLVKSRQDRGYDSESGLKRLKIKEIRPEDINAQESAFSLPQANDAQSKELQSKLEAEKKQLSRQADEYKKKYLKELEKNNLAVQGANNLPQKFDDVVKKNEALKRESAGMHYNLGVFFIKNKEYDRAIVEFEKSIELYPDDPYSYYNLGYIYAQYLVDRGKAVKYFRQFLQFVKNDDKDVEWVKDYLLTWEAYK